MTTSRPKQIRLTFTGEGASVLADLLWEEAPNTCRALVEAGPCRRTAHHAIYSGSEGVFILPQVLRIRPENATTQVRPGDVGFTWMAAGSHYGVAEDFAEVCWFYDRDAEPRMPEGPVPVSIFARLVDPVEEFVKVCFRMRREGVKPFALEFV